MEPSFSAEEEAQVMQFMTELAVLRENDPTAFKKAAASLGITNESDLSNFDISALTSSLREKHGLELKSDHSLDELKIKKNEPAVKSLMITPEPGFTLKTKKLDDDLKVFINICVHKDIFEPANKKKLNDQGEEVEGLNIPMSVGQARSDVDNSGAPCIIHDIIVNPLVIQETESDRTGKYRDFVCHLAIQCLEQKFKYQLDAKYKLPKSKYKGAVEAQRIQDRKSMPSIVEVESKNIPIVKPAGASTKKPAEVVEDRLPGVFCRWREGEGQPLQLGADYAEPTMRLPPAATAVIVEITLSMPRQQYDIDKNVTLKVSAFKMRMKAAGFKEVVLSFPFAVLPQTVTSEVSRSEGKQHALVLTVTLELDQADAGDGPDPGSKQWLLAHALHESDNPYATSDHRPLRAHSETAPSDGYAEDKFHIKLPANVDPYSGVALDSEELPEDAFHRKDASSAYLLEQRAKSMKEKAEKVEKERKERVDDPNVEYVDFEDYKKDGKYGTGAPEQSAGTSKSILENIGAIEEAKANERAFDVRALSSSLWADLL